MALFFIFSMLLEKVCKSPMDLRTVSSVVSVWTRPRGRILCGSCEFVDFPSCQISETFCILAGYLFSWNAMASRQWCSLLCWLGCCALVCLPSALQPSSVIFLILSMIVYGVAFDFSTYQVLFVDKECDSSIRSSAQGLFMLMTNGVGASKWAWLAHNGWWINTIKKRGFCAQVGDWVACGTPSRLMLCYRCSSSSFSTKKSHQNRQKNRQNDSEWYYWCKSTRISFGKRLI